ncbi:MAG TPA: carbonate dehydratase [Gemmatimonadales bacterium]|nr:carbonate dehydratase [Gemmatimonadales bacterium]
MADINELFANNRAWAASITRQDPTFFDELARQQSPRYLWIGCSDSRVPANQITGLLPGEVFVHRNVGNVVVHTDLNCLTVLQFAVDVIKVEHVIVCGHYGCGGVAAAWQGRPLGLIDNWLRHIQDVATRHYDLLMSFPDEPTRLDGLCALNALHMASNVCRTTIVQDAWKRGQHLTVHGWAYRLQDGLIRDLGFAVNAPGQMDPGYRQAVERIGSRAAL